RTACTRALVRGLARHRQQSGAEGSGRHTGAVDSAVHRAATAAAGPERAPATRGRYEHAGAESERRGAGPGRPEQRTRDDAGLSASGGWLFTVRPTASDLEGRSR